MDAFKVLLFLCIASFCECRDVSSNVGIYGGHKINIEQAPFMALVQIDTPLNATIMDSTKCGGSIINDRFILTAAHCCHYYKSNSYLLTLVGNTFGDIADLDQDNVYEAESISIHPNFTYTFHEFDACLIKVSKPIAFGDGVKTIELANSTMELPAGTTLNVTGWGNTEDGSTKHLMQISVPLVDPVQCQTNFRPNITHNMICAGARGKAPCGGDSGGPFTKGNIQVGLFSFYLSAGCQKAPGVGTKISSVFDWIQSTIHQIK